MSRLRYDVIVSGQIPQSGRGPLPDGSRRMWSPLSTTLILGERDVLLVDPPMTSAQAREVAAAVRRTGRRLVGIYVTHGHADHWLGAIPLTEQWPDAPVYARPGTSEMMAVQGSAEFRASFWDAVFPGQLPAGTVEPTPIGPEGIDLEGHDIVPIEVGHTDTDDTTVLHVPDLDLVVAGDAVYNGVHPYLTESHGLPGIDSWLSALDQIEVLAPRCVVAGHKDPARDDSPDQISRTRDYLLLARAALESSSDATEFYQTVLDAHPDRINPGALWGAAITLFP